MTRVLVASSPHYDDSHAVGTIIDALVQNAAGEIITLFLAHSGGACEIALDLVHDQVDAGLEVHFWMGEEVDRVFVFADEEFRPLPPLPTNVPITTFSSWLSSAGV